MDDIFQFEGFRLDRRGGGLFRRGERGSFVPIAIGSRALDVLGVLVGRPGDLVSRGELIAAVWPSTVVEESNLNMQIAALRRVLDDGRADGSCIQTIPGRGYRLVVPVTRAAPSASLVSLGEPGSGVEEPIAEAARPPQLHGVATDRDGEAPTERAPLPLPDKPSVAVLPFINMSTDPKQEFICDGITEDIITALSHYSSLFVIARNSCFTYKDRAVDVRQIGRELGVRYALEGSVRKAINRVRVTAQLVECETGKHVWAARYHHDLVDIFSLQDEITAAVTTSIAPVIADFERLRAARKAPGNLDAWTACQRGWWHMSKLSPADNALAEKFFRRAIDLDATFAGGYIGLVSVLADASTVFLTRSPEETQSLSEAFARRAVALDGTNAEAHASLGSTLWLRGDHEGARAEAEQALAINPNLARGHAVLGMALVHSGRAKDGLAALETCIRLDPLDTGLAARLQQVTAALYFLREYEAAVARAKRVVRSYPDFPPIYRWLAAALGQLGRTEEAQEALAKSIAIAPALLDAQRTRRIMRQEDHAHLLEGLRKAGWPH
jgi:adenylate cyclase